MVSERLIEKATECGVKVIDKGYEVVSPTGSKYHIEYNDNFMEMKCKCDWMTKWSIDLETGKPKSLCAHCIAVLIYLSEKELISLEKRKEFEELIK